MKIFPVLRQGPYFMMDHCRRSIPWQVIEPFAERAATNHSGQSLETLAQRGGLSPCEIYAVLNNKSWKKVHPEFAVQFINNLGAEP